MFNPMSLDGRHILITGASSGIGRACAILASRLGASVTLVARREEALEETRHQMECPERHHCVVADLCQQKSAKVVMDNALNYGKIDGLVHAAGISPILPIGVLSELMPMEALQVNLLSFLQLVKFYSKCKYGIPGGSIVALSSISAEVGWPTGSVYCATKGALSSAVRALSLELSDAKTRVNAVMPSYIKTPMSEAMQESFVEKTEQNDPTKLQPLGWGEPEQVASVVCFLLSGASSFITGANIPVDGGYLAK